VDKVNKQVMEFVDNKSFDIGRITNELKEDRFKEQLEAIEEERKKRKDIEEFDKKFKNFMKSCDNFNNTFLKVFGWIFFLSMIVKIISTLLP
jgi:IS4 transposase